MADDQPPMPPDVTGPADSPSPPEPPSPAAPPTSRDYTFDDALVPPPPPPPAEPPPSAEPTPSAEPAQSGEPPSVTPATPGPPPLTSEQLEPTAPPGPAPPQPSSEPPAPTEPPSALADLRAPAPFEAPSATELTKPPRRRRRGLVALVVVLVLLIAGGGTAGVLLLRSTGAKAGPTASGGACGGAGSPAASTVSYTDPDQYYTAQFACAPKYHSTSQTSSVGDVPYLYAEYQGPDVDQLVGVLVFSPGTSFDPTKGLQGIAGAGSGSVISSTPSTFQGYPSLEGVINLQGDYLKVQIVHVGNLAYIIGTAGPVNPPSDYARFIAAVHITPH